MSTTSLAFVMLAIGFMATPALAQSGAPSSSPLSQPGPDTGQASGSVEMMDVADLIRRLRHKPEPPGASDYRRRMRAVAPVIGAKPSTGVIIGVAGNVAFYRGDPVTTHISSSVASVTITSKKQAGISARTTMFGRDDRWRAEADYRFQWTSLDTFGLGVASAEDAAVLARFDFYRLSQSVYYRARPNLFVGGGLHFDNHTDVRPAEDAAETWPDSSYVRYSEGHGLPLDTQISAGPSAEIIWDSRDSVINAGRGWLGRIGYRAMFDGFLGGDSRWDRVTVDARAYKALATTGRHTLAAWAYADLVVNGVAPYFDLPSTGSDTYGRSGRGYAEGHFRGEKLAFVELEYRGSLMRNGLLGWVAFLNTTTVSNEEAGERLFDHFAAGGGAGLRLLLNKRSKTNLAFDVGFGEQGNRGIYLAIQEAF